MFSEVNFPDPIIVDGKFEMGGTVALFILFPLFVLKGDVASPVKFADGKFNEAKIGLLVPGPIFAVASPKFIT
jgi:hypothetical protein